MSRRSWGWVMLLALVLAGGSLNFILTKLNERAAPVPVRVKAVPAPKPAPSVVASTAAVVAVSSPTAPTVAVASTTVAVAAPKADGKEKRNVLFKLARPGIKEVALIGDFNGWVRKPMKKVGKAWQTSVSLAPGKYEYNFVVDGKRIRDPNNKQSASGGKTSLLSVKPLASRP